MLGRVLTKQVIGLLIAALALFGVFEALQGRYWITACVLFGVFVGTLTWLFHEWQKMAYAFYQTFISWEMGDWGQSALFQRFLPAKLQKTFFRAVEQIRKERLEKQSQDLYLRSVVQHIPIGLLSFDHTGKIDFCNTAVLQILRCLPFKNLDELPSTYEPLKIALQSNSKRQMIRLLVEDEVLELIVTLSQVQILGKNYTIASLQDFQAELEEKEMQAWQNLTRILTHEILNSVTPISSLAATALENLQENPTDTTEIEQALQIIQKRSQNLTQFVQEFRAFTKLPTPTPQPILLSELFANLQKLIENDLKDRNITFRSIVFPENLTLYADLMMTEQVLINLLRNAIQAVADVENPEIQLIAQQDLLGKVLIKVEDNGVGISDEAKKSIFVPFFTTKKTGSGIGLSLSKQMMRVQGGTISVHSVLGKGTTFTLRF
ncbi:MAG: ATP-binding protein [Raineya sp.]|nr:ATP-binding protein [Raineya sp.]MDW8296415.1 ATP-binding protein [Raineya sp.]